jgi:thiol-disulfide isomerase/thioredoxin
MPKIRMKMNGNMTAIMICRILFVLLLVNIFIFYVLSKTQENLPTESVINISTSKIAARFDHWKEWLTKQNNSKPLTDDSSKGLYKGDKLIQELRSINDVKELVLGNSPLSPTTYLIIVFYASWCPHCRHFAPFYKDFAKKVKAAEIRYNQQFTILNNIHDNHHGQESSSNGVSSEIHLKLAAINCPNNMIVCEKLSIDGYPTVAAFHFPISTSKSSNNQCK